MTKNNPRNRFKNYQKFHVYLKTSKAFQVVHKSFDSFCLRRILNLGPLARFRNFQQNVFDYPDLVNPRTFKNDRPFSSANLLKSFQIFGGDRGGKGEIKIYQKSAPI